MNMTPVYLRTWFCFWGNMEDWLSHLRKVFVPMQKAPGTTWCWRPLGRVMSMSRTWVEQSRFRSHERIRARSWVSRNSCDMLLILCLSVAVGYNGACELDVLPLVMFWRRASCVALMGDEILAACDKISRGRSGEDAVAARDAGWCEEQTGGCNSAKLVTTTEPCEPQYC